MGALRSLLEVYGVLDDAVSQSDDPAVAATVDAFLPRASANVGWYRELETYFFGANAKPAPNVSEAIGELVRQEQAGNPLTTSQKSRLFYSFSALTRLGQVVPNTTFAAPRTSEPNETLVGALTLLGPAGMPFDARRNNALGVADSFLDAVSYRFPNRDRFYDFRAYAASNDWIDEETLNIPLCDASVVDVDGIESVVVDTVCQSRTVTLKDLKGIVNPFNWHANYDDFFCNMAVCGEPQRPDGWRRVLESVGFCEAGGLRLRTALKYLGTADHRYPLEGRLDYDLDDPPRGDGDGRVTVDRGYINMWAVNDDKDPTKPGVLVRTRKVVHINGLLPYAQARLVCITGYGTASSEFLFPKPPPGGAKVPRQPFEYYDTGVPLPTNQPGGTTVSSPKPPPADHAVTSVVKLWSDSVRDITTGYFDLAGKLATGKLRYDDVANYGKDVSERLLQRPLEYLDTVALPRYPGSDTPGSVNPNATLAHQENTTRALLYQLNKIIGDAAVEDKAGKWGLDSWIRTIHNLIDLQIRTYAAILRAGIDDLSLFDVFLGVPLPSEPMDVPHPQQFALNIQAVEFTRVGKPNTKLDGSHIGFLPEYLPAGATTFRMFVKDYRFIGHNYTGKIVLTNRGDGTPSYYEKFEVTVGL
jgi:hypothetical protein